MFQFIDNYSVNATIQVYQELNFLLLISINSSLKIFAKFINGITIIIIINIL